MKIYIKYEDPGTKTETFQTIEQRGLERIMENFKATVIAILLPIEQEINDEGGIIVLKEDGTVNPEGFSNTLVLRINMLLFDSLHE